MLVAALAVISCSGEANPAQSAVPESAVEAFALGTYAEATTDELTIRREAGSPVVVSSLYAGEWLQAMSPPNMIAGVAWIRVQYGGGLFGWIGVEPDDPPLARLDPECPEGPNGRALEVSEVVEMTVVERLACFGADEITLTPVTWRDLQPDSLYGGEPAWLADDASLQLYGRGGWDLEEPIGAHIDPNSAIELRGDGWASIRGRFDHPASNECARDIDLAGMGIVDEEEVIADLAPMTRDDSTVWCRQQFVITDVVQIAAPPPLVVAEPPPAGGTWRAIPEAPLLGRSENGAVWTGSEMVVWGGRAVDPESPVQAFVAADGAAYDPAENSWRLIAEAPIAGRAQPLMAWTGREVLVLGGSDDALEPMTDGAAYDPAADTWRVLLPMPSNVATGLTAFTWTGEELIILAADGAGAAYSPTDDTWRELPESPLPGDLWNLGLVWTGEEAIAMAYPNGISVTAVGAAYDPQTGAWRELPESPVVALNGWAPVWIDGEILVISRSLATGQPESVPPDTTYVSLYDPETNAWRTAGAQEVYQPTGSSVWTGRQLITGDAAYDPASDTWLALPSRPLREGPHPLWTGEEMLLWAGGPGGESMFRLNDGLAYRPDEP